MQNARAMRRHFPGVFYAARQPGAAAQKGAALKTARSPNGPGRLFILLFSPEHLIKRVELLFGIVFHHNPAALLCA